MDTKIPTSIDVSDQMSVHLSYIRRDLDELKVIQKQHHSETLIKFEELQNHYVTRVDFNDHLKADEDHEQRLRGLEEDKWKRAGISSSVGAIVGVVSGIIINLLSK